MLTYETFSTRVVERMHIDVPLPVAPEAGLYTDLALDSFQSLELLVVVEAMADIEIPPPVLPEIYTMGDAYEYYGSLLADA